MFTCARRSASLRLSGIAMLSACGSGSGPDPQIGAGADAGADGAAEAADGGGRGPDPAGDGGAPLDDCPAPCSIAWREAEEYPVPSDHHTTFVHEGPAGVALFVVGGLQAEGEAVSG